MNSSNFYTLRGYSRMESEEISHTMEDYLEMIYRCTREGSFIRVNQLAAKLNVRPPSASKMAAKLRDSGMIAYEPYGVIHLTPQGRELGAYLLHRHNLLHDLFCLINGTDNELELVEQIEHYVDSRTVENIVAFLNQQDRRKAPAPDNPNQDTKKQADSSP